jgi:Protein of unknown function (DUF1566)
MNQKQTSLVFHENGTATDSTTGLVWMLPAVGQGWSNGAEQGSWVELCWGEASSRYGRARNIVASAVECQWKNSFWQKYPLSQETYNGFKRGTKQLDFAGSQDWRLPTVEEYWSLHQAGVGDSYMNGRPYQVWTANSTSLASNPLKALYYRADLGGDCAWMFQLNEDSSGFGDMKTRDAYPIRLVRGGRIFEALF